MNLSDLARTLRSLSARPGRTALTLLGIVIGSGAIVLVAGLVAGGKAALVRTSQQATGSNLVRIQSRELPQAERVRGRPRLSRSDAAALEHSWAASGGTAHARSSRQVRASFAGRLKKVRMVSGNPRVAGLYELQVHSGRFLSGRDLHERRRVCVVGHEVWVKLMGRADLTRELNLKMAGQLWKVVGVLEAKTDHGVDNRDEHLGPKGHRTGNDLRPRLRLRPRSGRNHGFQW